MPDIAYIREHLDTSKKAVESKAVVVDLDLLVALDTEVRSLQARVDELRQEQNQLAKSLGSREAADQHRDQISKLKNDLKQVEDEFVGKRDKRDKLFSSVPNFPLPDVTVGKDESENEQIKKVGTPAGPSGEKIRDHVAIGKALDIIDIESAAKVSGTRFAYLKNEGVLLELALVQYAMNILLAKGFAPVIPPAIISEESMVGMGHTENGGSEDMYYIEKDKKYFIGTSEQAIGPMLAGETVESDKLPLRYAGYSPCFRRESGSYGKDTKGLLRVHHFDKVEMFSFVHPEDGESEFEFLLQCAEDLMQSLEIPYRLMKMCTGDLGVPAARKIDIESWIPSQGIYRETHSISTCTDYQARRLQIKYRDEKGKKDFVFMLNGTAFAIGRTLIAILENFQQADGSVVIPKVLRPYMNGLEVILPKKTS
ncbi:MAG: serine--tRNA ligase [Patescibacteria group bacterium]|jgi:seryl-tRNA synthetase